MNFKSYFNESEESQDIKHALSMLPTSHQKLVAGYQIKFQPGNTLKNDNESIGEVDEKNKTITICGPWHYSRQTTFLHEVAHRVWEKLVSNEQKKAWKKLYKETQMEKKDRQNAEEIFCMSYSATYSKHPPVTYYKPAWVKFIKSLSAS